MDTTRTFGRPDDVDPVRHLGGCSDDRAIGIPLPEGWNCLVRLYRPQAEILNGSWRFPAVEPAK